MNILSFFKPAVKPLVDGLLAQAEAKKPEVLAALAGENVKGADAIEKMLISGLQKDPHTAALLKVVDVKALASGLHDQLVAQLGSIEAVEYEILLAKVRAIEAQALG